MNEVTLSIQICAGEKADALSFSSQQTNNWAKLRDGPDPHGFNRQQKDAINFHLLYL